MKLLSSLIISGDAFTQSVLHMWIYSLMPEEQKLFWSQYCFWWTSLLPERPAVVYTILKVLKKALVNGI